MEVFAAEENFVDVTMGASDGYLGAGALLFLLGGLMILP